MALRQFKGEKERKENLKHLLKSRPIGPLLKRSLSDSTGIVPGTTITLPITQDHTLIGQEAIDGQKIIDKYDLARGGKKSRKKKRKKKKKSRKKRGSCKGWNCFRKSTSGQFAKTKPGYHQVKPQESSQSQSKIPKTKSGVFPKELRRRSPIPDPLVKPMKFAHADTATSAHRSLYKSGHTFDDSFLKKPIPKKTIEFGKGKGGKRSRKKRKKRKKKKKSRRRKKKAGFLLEGSLAYYLYQTKMKGKKAIFNWPVQYKDKDPEPVAQDAPADPTPPPATGGKKSRKKHRRKSKKTRKKRGGADSLRDGIRKIYEGKKSLNFGVVDSGPGSWGKQLNELYAEYIRHLEALTKGQKFARKVKNIFRKGDSKKPLTEGEADRIFYDEATNMIGILERNFQEPIRQSISEINMNPNAMIYSDMERRSDPEKERLSMQILEERPRLQSLEEQIEGSIYELTQLIRAIKRSRANSIPSRGSSMETRFTDSFSDLNIQPYRGLDSTPPEVKKWKKEKFDYIDV